MCGRYATSRSAADLTALFEAADDTAGVSRADYNVAPTRPVPIVRVSASLGGRALSIARWGLTPQWTRDPRAGARMINARAERIATAPAFAASFARRRCLVPADGWYEWRRRDDGPGKQPYFMTPRGGGGLAFAGVWTRDAVGTLTFAIVTLAARGDLTRVHDRMPLVLPPDRWRRWLDTPADRADPAVLLAPPPDGVLADLEIRPVGAAVGDVRMVGPELTMPVAVTRSSNMTLF